MGIISDIRGIVRDLYQLAGEMALWCWDNDPPFGWFGDRFLDIYDFLTDLHYVLYQLQRDYNDLWDMVLDTLTQSDIFQMLQTWLNYAEDAWNWILNSVLYIGSIVEDWWLEKRAIVEGWIAIATEGLAEIIDLWDTFWEDIYPNLISFDWLSIWWNSRLLDIDSLISSWFVSFAPFWEGWIEVREEVTNFFSDPLQWFYNKLDEFFERFW